MISSIKHALCGALVLFFLFVGLRQISAQSNSFASIHKDMVYNTIGLGDAYALFDQNPATVFSPVHQNGFEVVPAEIVLRLKSTGQNTLTQISFITAAGAKGQVMLFVGSPGHWLPLSTTPQQYGNGISGLAWYPLMHNVRFVKAVFSHIPGDINPLKTGEFLFALAGDYAYNDQDACSNGQANCKTASQSFDQFLGINNFLGKTQLVNQFAPFTAVREYLPWDNVQGHILSGASIYNEDHLMRFSPAFPGYDIDRHYANLAGAGKELLIDFKESSPYQMYFDYNGGQGTTLNQLGLSFSQLGGAYLDLMERKPGRPEGGVNPNALGFNAPSTYRDHADAVFQTTLRYGTGGDGSKEQFADAASKANQNTAKWIENWNEHDKWWSQPNVQAPVDPQQEKRLAYFSPKEYMAMTYADYHPVAGQLSLPLVMSGLSELDVEYLKGMYMSWWELTGNDPSLSQNWPFKAINYHHYSIQNWQNGIAPEKDPFIDGSNSSAQLSRITSFVHKYLNDNELWITEFGYSDHPQDITSAKANYPNADYEEVQAEWILRSYLQYYRYGVDRAFAYQLVDDGPNQWSGVFNHTGMIDRTDAGGGTPEYRMKKSWYYTYTLKQYLEGMHFTTESTAQTLQNRPVRRYDFTSSDGQKQISALWVPDDTNPALGQMQLAMNGHTQVQIVRFAHEKIGGTSELAIDTDQDGYITLDGIGERPLLIVWDTIASVAECGCSTDFTLKSGNQAAFQAITDIKSSISGTEHPKCNYGPSAATNWDTPQAETLVLNLGGGSETDTWQVDAIYVNDPAWNSGSVQFELLDSVGTIAKLWNYAFDGEPMYPYNTQGAAYVWKTFDGLNTKASQLRMTKTAGVKVGELMLCARPASGAQTVPPPVIPPVVPPIVPPVVTNPPVTPAPPTTAPVSCDCQPFPVAPVSVQYQLAPGQTLPPSNTLFAACLDNVADKSPSRMFDEQNATVLGMICSAQYDLLGQAPDYTDCTHAQQDGYPIQEWFPGWSNQYPYKAIVDFQNPIEFLSLFLYDSNDEGQIGIEYREDNTSPWKTLSLNGDKTISTNQYRKWRSIHQSSDITIAKQLRITMYSQGARFSELAFCGHKDVRKATGLNEPQETEDENALDQDVSGLRQISQPPNNPNQLSLTQEDQWAVFPNPADRFVTVAGVPATATELVLYDMIGRELATYAAPQQGKSLTIPVDKLQTGVYMLTVKAGKTALIMERILVK